MQRRMRLRLLSLFVAVGAAIGLILGPTSALGHDPVIGVVPQTVEAILAEGESLNVNKVVHTRAVPPVADFYFLADNTGSMGPAIANVKANAATIINTLHAAVGDHRFGAGSYQDFPGTAFTNCSSINPAADDHGAAALACINAWSASGGGDIAEGQIWALHQLTGHGVANFRPAATKFVVWFGDAPGHDPVCGAVAGHPHDTDEALLTANLVGAGVKVVAVSVDSGPGLDADPTLYDGDYTPPCLTEGGSAGQASRLAAATGGAFLNNVPADQVAQAILNAIGAVQVTVTPEVVSCSTGLQVTFAPPSRVVTAGEDAAFTETITVLPSAPDAGGTLTCTVRFLINGQPAGPEFTQTITIRVPARFCTLKAQGTSFDFRRYLDAYAAFEPGYPRIFGAVVHTDKANFAGNLQSSNITRLLCFGPTNAIVTGTGTTPLGVRGYTLEVWDNGAIDAYNIQWAGYSAGGPIFGQVIILPHG